MSPADIGRWIREQRLARGWTQPELAQRAGICDPSVVSKYEHGRQTPRGDALMRLRAVLGEPSVEPEPRPDPVAIIDRWLDAYPEEAATADGGIFMARYVLLRVRSELLAAATPTTPSEAR